MLSIAALNAEPEAATDAVAAAPGETLEAQEAGAVAAMEAALARVHAGDAEGAEVRRRRGGHVDASCARRRFRRPSRRPAARVACARSRVGPGAGVGTHPTPPLTHPRIVFENVSFAYPSRPGAVLRGASLFNIAALVGGRILGGARLPGEPVRHRALDLLGDLAFLSAPLAARITARRPTHEMALEMVGLILEDQAEQAALG